jgi:hypothetical protein
VKYVLLMIHMSLSGDPLSVYVVEEDLSLETCAGMAAMERSAWLHIPEEKRRPTKFVCEEMNPE